VRLFADALGQCCEKCQRFGAAWCKKQQIISTVEFVFFPYLVFLCESTDGFV